MHSMLGSQVFHKDFWPLGTGQHFC